MHPPIYPQLNLPNDTTDVSSALADMVTGTFSFEGMDHATRVNRLVALISLYNLVRELGDHEHTGDWDWRITVNVKDDRVGSVDVGTVYTEDYDNDTWADTLELNYDRVPNDYADGFARWHELTIEIFPNSASPNEYRRLIPIDRINSITIGEA